jgi:histone H3/H4
MSESEIGLPTTVIKRIVKAKLAEQFSGDDGKPKDVNLSKEALLAFGESAKVFINYLTAMANDICHEGKRQTISAEDVFKALGEMEFEELVAPLKEALQGGLDACGPRSIGSLQLRRAPGGQGARPCRLRRACVLAAAQPPGFMVVYRPARAQPAVARNPPRLPPTTTTTTHPLPQPSRPAPRRRTPGGRRPGSARPRSRSRRLGRARTSSRWALATRLAGVCAGAGGSASCRSPPSGRRPAEPVALCCRGPVLAAQRRSAQPRRSGVQAGDQGEGQQGEEEEDGEGVEAGEGRQEQEEGEQAGEAMEEDAA